ncbi:MAG: RdgB/HAM1 family non-canonical purine NTP pyrophosphatase [Spirochaetales bacterium]|nr:RdgB/HAM1 family non-canonical purine NTP pyrophosphatase [Spirochaetales bacterium]
MEIILASNNPGKAREFSRLLKNHTIILPAERGIDFEYNENGVSFLENAFGKANELYKLVKIPVIADDSGLCVEALNGEPGVFSARYGSDASVKKLTSPERNDLLLSRMQNISNRRAFFVCCMVLFLDTYRFYVAQEIFCGEIAQGPAGTNGFGYDPVFYIPGYGKTAAQIGDHEKDKLSHRGKAARQLSKFLE